MYAGAGKRRSSRWLHMAHLGFPSYDSDYIDFYPLSSKSFVHVRDMTDTKLLKAIKELKLEFIRAKLTNTVTKGNLLFYSANNVQHLARLLGDIEFSYPTYTALVKEAKRRKIHE